MTNQAQNIRDLMNRISGIQEGRATLMEGWVSNLKDKLNRRLGEKERDALVGRLQGEWNKWLGQTSRSGDMSDLIRFMQVRIGFTDEDIQNIKKELSDLDASDAPQSAIEPEAPKTQEPQDGVPLPKDLNAKLSDFGKVGIDVEKNDNITDPGEIVDNPRKYQLPNGDWDRKKIRSKLDKMNLGDKLTLGSVSFSRTATPGPDNFYKESITEAQGDPLSRTEVNDILDLAGSYINDKYLYDGPANNANDQEDQAPQRSQGNQGPRIYGRSGQYDAKGMNHILVQEIGMTKGRYSSIRDKAERTSSISDMTDQEMSDLSAIGYAFLRSRG
jgi:hypothetical protein